MIEDTDNLISFAPHVPVSDGMTFADIAQILPPEAFDMASTLDLVYLISQPLFALLFGYFAILQRRSNALAKEASDRSIKQNDEAWEKAHKKFDKLVDSMHLLALGAAESETRLSMHIQDKSAHNYGRRDGE